MHQRAFHWVTAATAVAAALAAALGLALGTAGPQAGPAIAQLAAVWHTPTL